MVAVGVDDRVQLLRIRLLEQTQPRAVSELDATCVIAGFAAVQSHSRHLAARRE
jgi:hypothetical protein